MNFKKIIKEYKDRVTKIVQWHLLSKHKYLSEDFIEKHADKVNFQNISMHQTLSESFIEKYEDKLDWDYISAYQTLSESFIEKYEDKLRWIFISKYQKLSESFIEKHYDKVYWRYISSYQKLSDDFCNKYGIRSSILNVVHYCGKYNRCVYILKDDPEIIYIGCFKGTKDEAIKAIRKKYKNNEEDMLEYIRKVEECFNY